MGRNLEIDLFSISDIVANKNEVWSDALTSCDRIDASLCRTKILPVDNHNRDQRKNIGHNRNRGEMVLRSRSERRFPGHLQLLSPREDVQVNRNSGTQRSLVCP